MSMSLFFRVAFLLLWVTFGVVRGYYGRKTKTHDSLVGIKEKLKTAEMEMGKGFKILTGIITVIGAIGLIMYLLAPPWWTWTQFPTGEWLQWIGIIVTIPPIFYLIWVHRHLDIQWSIALELQNDHKLITTGPYKSVRHPMYLGIFLYTIGMILISSDLLVFLFFGFSIWVNYQRIPSEEQMMIEEFGDDYREYMKQTGKLFPPIRKTQDNR